MRDSDRNIANGQSSDKGNSSLVHNGSTLSQLDSLVTKVTNKSLHTPGKWGIVDTPAIRYVYHGCAVIGSSEIDDAIIATIGEDVPGHEANAHLIAAAPDMLEALENLENDANSIPDHAWKLVTAAIAKAKGGAA